MSISKRRLGTNGPATPPLGFGCMVLSGTYGPVEEKEALSTLQRALELGCTFWDTADVYGHGHNEQLVGRALRGRRSEVTLATKCGFVWSDSKEGDDIDGSPQHIKAACDASLRRLGTDVIDLYYLHRLDPKPARRVHIHFNIVRIETLPRLASGQANGFLVNPGRRFGRAHLMREHSVVKIPEKRIVGAQHGDVDGIGVR